MKSVAAGVELRGERQCSASRDQQVPGVFLGQPTPARRRPGSEAVTRGKRNVHS